MVAGRQRSKEMFSSINESEVSMNVENLKITFIGLGEAATALISGWGKAHNRKITAYDIKLNATETRSEIAFRAQSLGITYVNTIKESLAQADVVFSTVTADQALQAARSSAPYVKAGTYWFDLNSCAPDSKKQAAALLEKHSARYVDVAVMAPVYPKQNLVPLLISGRWAPRVASFLETLPMRPRIIEGSVGKASAIKMVRSIMVKGLEALTAECTLAAAAADVADEVFPSLKAAHPFIDVPKRSIYNFERSMSHGIRRAAEMHEVAKMLDGLGLPNDMSTATAQWQKRLANKTDEDIAIEDANDLHAFSNILMPRVRSF